MLESLQLHATSVPTLTVTQSLDEPESLAPGGGLVYTPMGYKMTDEDSESLRQGRWRHAISQSQSDSIQSFNTDSSQNLSSDWRVRYKGDTKSLMGDALWNPQLNAVCEDAFHEGKDKNEESYLFLRGWRGVFDFFNGYKA